MINATEVYGITFQIIPYGKKLFRKRNVYEQSISNRLKQFVFMATDYVVNGHGQCKIITKFQINKTK